MVGKKSLGCFFMVLQAVFLNACFTMLRTMDESGWPQTTMYSASSATSTLAILVGVLVSKTPWPALGERRWVVLAGTFWASSFVCALFAVLLKTPLGDVAALSSVSVVFAAFMGRIFLGESLRWVHIFAVVCSVAGALLIAKPSMLFGSDGSSVSLVGYVLPIFGGIFDSCILICGRKSPNSSSWFHALSTQIQSSLAFFALSFSPLVKTLDFRPVLAHPLEAVGWIGAIFVLDSLNIVLYCTAGQWVPAAMAASVNNFAYMVVGYVFQVLFFASPVEPLTLVGAGLMMLGVGSMSMVREPPPLGAADLDVATNSSETPSIADDDSESIASFAASEFVDEEPRARRRAITAGKKPDVEAHIAAVPIGMIVGL